MNTIKFIIGVAVIGFALMGFITLDPAFKGSAKSSHMVKELSMIDQHTVAGIQENLQ
jgi:hypothetical protein